MSMLRMACVAQALVMICLAKKTWLVPSGSTGRGSASGRHLKRKMRPWTGLVDTPMGVHLNGVDNRIPHLT